MTDDPRRGLSSASIMYRVANCSGSETLILSLREVGKYYELPSLAIASGNRIHNYLEFEGLGLSAQAEDFFKVLNTEERAVSRKAVEIRNSLVDEFLGNGSQKEIIVEKRFWYRQHLRPRFSGQPDFIAIKDRRALIVNYKSGRVEAEPAADNLQLRTEAVLLKHNRPELEQIIASIVEPLVSWESEAVAYDQKDLARAEQEILAFVDRAQWNRETRVAGVWCRYCNARAHCREALAYINSFPSPRPENLISELPRGDAGTQLWEKIKVAKKLLETLEQTYTRILEDEPSALPGYILPRQGRPRRIVPFPAKLKEALSKYLTGDEVDGCANFNLTKIEELIGIKHRVLDKAELKQLFAALTKDVLSVIHDTPFIRPMTKREREMLAKV